MLDISLIDLDISLNQFRDISKSTHSWNETGLSQATFSVKECFPSTRQEKRKENNFRKKIQDVPVREAIIISGVAQIRAIRDISNSN